MSSPSHPAPDRLVDIDYPRAADVAPVFAYPTPISRPPRLTPFASTAQDLSALAAVQFEPTHPLDMPLEPETITYLPGSTMSLQHPSSLPLPYGPYAYPPANPFQSSSFATTTPASAPAPYAPCADVDFPPTRLDHVTVSHTGSSYAEPRATPPIATTPRVHYGSSLREPGASRVASPVYTRSPAGHQPAAGPRVPDMHYHSFPSHPSFYPFAFPGSHPSMFYSAPPPAPYFHSPYPPAPFYHTPQMHPAAMYHPPPPPGSIPGAAAAPTAPPRSDAASPSSMDVVYDPDTIHPDHPLHDRSSPYSAYVVYGDPTFRVPTVTSALLDIPLLTGRENFVKWRETSLDAVSTLSNTLFRHLIDKAPPFDPENGPPVAKDVPLFCPTRLRTREDVKVASVWWDADSTVLTILRKRIAPGLSVGPLSAGGTASRKVTARAFLASVDHWAGCGSASTIQFLKNRLRNLAPRSASAIDMLAYIDAFRAGLSAIGQSAGTSPLGQVDDEADFWFMEHLPRSGEWTTLTSLIRTTTDAGQHILPIEFLDRARSIALGYHPDNQVGGPPPVRRPPPGPRVPPPPVASMPTPQAPPQANIGPFRAAPPSGGRPAPRSGPPAGGARTGVPTAFVAAPVNDGGGGGPPPAIPIPTAPPSLSGVDSAPVSVDAFNVQYNASSAYSAFAFSALSEDLSSAFSGPPALSAASPPLNLSTFLSQHPGMLDTGCTKHIFRSRDDFHEFDDRTSAPVQTASKTSLAVLGGGVVLSRVLAEDGNWYPLRWTSVAYAPDCPINLLSVGQMCEKGFTFQWGSQVQIAFPANLGPIQTTAVPHGRLHFLRMEIVRTTPSLSHELAFPPIDFVAPVFAKPVLTQELWHQRFGHLNFDSTNKMLSSTQTFATGIVCVGPHSASPHCVGCLLGKSARPSFAHPGNRATEKNELLHMDTCGPFPTVSFAKFAYAWVVLDDKTNWAESRGLRHRNDAYDAMVEIVAEWERQAGHPVLHVRCDGALEFIAGRLEQFFRNRGIVVEQTAPYIHQQNGKAERYIRTLENTMKSLLAASGLPMTFWFDAWYCAQYLRNRLPTSTLPDGITPYEARWGKKPDLGHLRVFGCRCYAYYPKELEEKGGRRMYEGIFVGYEEARKGYWIRESANGRLHFAHTAVFDEHTPGTLRRAVNTTDSIESVPSQPLLPPAVHAPSSEGVSAVTDAAHGGKDAPSGGAPTSRDGGRLRPHASLQLTEKGQSYVKTLRARTSRQAAAAAASQHASIALAPISIDELYDFAGLSDIDHLRSLADLGVSLGDQEADVYFQHVAFDAPQPSISPSWDPRRPPRNFSEAMKRPDWSVWWDACTREITSINEKGVFEPCPLPADARALPLQWVFAWKADPVSGNPCHLAKARLVAGGNFQRPGEYGDTYAPVVRTSSVRIIAAYINYRRWYSKQFDFSVAFLNGILKELVYCRPIPGFPLKDLSHVLRAIRSIYGLKQSARAWYSALRAALEEIGFTVCDVDQAVFFAYWTQSPDPSVPLVDGTLEMIIGIHVDDGICGTNSEAFYDWLIMRLRQHFELKDLGNLDVFLGMKFRRNYDSCRLWISMENFIDDLLDANGMKDCHNHDVPLTMQPADVKPHPDAFPHLSDAQVKAEFQSLIGSFNWLAMTARPDLAFTVTALGQFNANPSRGHLLLAKGVLRYLRKTRFFALQFDGLLPVTAPVIDSSIPLSDTSLRTTGLGYSDADWASDSATRRSISGYSIFLYGGLVSWSAVKQKSVALSSTEAEYAAMTHLLREALWMRLFARATHLPLPTPFPLRVDNRSALCLADGEGTSNRTKHVDVKFHFIRTYINDGSFSPSWIPTDEMVADIFTKPLPSATHHKHCRSLGLVSLR